MVKKVVIVGAGPSGILLAHHLLKRDCQYQVDIYERLSDLRARSLSRSRTFPIALNRLLNEYADDLNLVLEQLTKRRLADAHAVVELSNYTLPFKQSLFVQLIIRQRIAKLLHRLFPQRFLPPLFEALHESSIPYADILQEYQGWCNKVKKSKAEFSSIS